MTQSHMQQLSAAQWLRGRRLVTLQESEVNLLSDLIENDTEVGSWIDGLIVMGPTATTTARNLRARHPGLIVMVEPRATASAIATADDPFVLEKGGLFDTSLADLITDRIENGDDFALAPTGYITHLEPDGLKAVIANANDIETDRLIVPIPLDSAWLKSSHRRQLIAILNQSRHPLLVSLGAQGDPLGSSDKVDGLVYLLMNTDHVSFTRADHLVGLEVLARTRNSVAFGTIPSRRRTTPPGTSGFSSDPTENRPHVYFPTLHRFVRGKVSRGWFASTPPPRCDPSCCGRELDGFQATVEDRNAALSHNTRCLLALAARVAGTSQQRLDTVRRIYDEAEVEHRKWEQRLGLPLSVPGDQHRLGQLIGQLPTIAHTQTQQTTTRNW